MDASTKRRIKEDHLRGADAIRGYGENMGFKIKVYPCDDKILVYLNTKSEFSLSRVRNTIETRLCPGLTVEYLPYSDWETVGSVMDR